MLQYWLYCRKRAAFIPPNTGRGDNIESMFSQRYRLWINIDHSTFGQRLVELQGETGWHADNLGRKQSNRSNISVTYSQNNH